MQIPKLKEWRERRGLTQKELAQVAKVSPRSVAGYEAGQSIRPNTARKIADALEIAVEDLMNTAGEYELDGWEKSRPKAEALSESGPPKRETLPNFKDFLQKECGSFYLALPHDLIRQLWEQADTPQTRWRLYEQIRREHAAVAKLADEKRDRLGEVQRIKLDDVWLRQANTRMLEATELVRQKSQT